MPCQRANGSDGPMAIQQKLQTKLAQKLILTPSLQQAIKLLPMSTLELADLLNQEVVENPLLEEVPTEDLQTTEAQAQEKEEPPPQQKTDTWDDQDYEYFFGEYLDDGYQPEAPQEVRELPPIENTLSTGALAHRSPHLAAVDPDQRRRADARDRRGHHRQPGRRRLPGGVGGRACEHGPVADRGSRAGAPPAAGLRSDRRLRTRLAGVLDAPAPPPRARRDADRKDHHRAPAAAAEPPDSRARQEAGRHHRRAQRAHRDHQASRSQARQPATTRSSPST